MKKLTNIKINIADNIKEKFWDMFIIDCLIGNTDRHNGNWGLLVNTINKEARFSPIYDCGSCLNPMIEDTQIQEINDVEIKNLAINNYSCIRENGKKINYITYMRNKENTDCNNAIKRVFEKIDINKINTFIDEIQSISDIRKEFYKKIINYRYEIIKDIYKKI